MIRGYALSGYDNDSHMCSSADQVFDDIEDLEICTACGYRTDFDFVNPLFTLSRKVQDISYTYDGYCIVSLRFKEACERKSLTGLRFISLPKEKTYFYFAPEPLVKFDYERRETRFENKCETCGNFESVVGAWPVFLRSKLTADFNRTDLSFGSGNEKHPLLIISQVAKDIIEMEKIKGAIFEQIRT